MNLYTHIFDSDKHGYFITQNLALDFNSSFEELFKNLNNKNIFGLGPKTHKILYEEFLSKDIEIHRLNEVLNLWQINLFKYFVCCYDTIIETTNVINDNKICFTFHLLFDGGNYNSQYLCNNISEALEMWKQNDYYIDLLGDNLQSKILPEKIQKNDKLTNVYELHYEVDKATSFDLFIVETKA